MRRLSVTRFVVVALATVAVCRLSTATAVASQSSFEQTLQALASGSVGERSMAVAAIEGSPSLREDERVRTALIAELERVQRERFALADRRARGEFIVPNEGSAEYYLAIVGVVANLHDPRAIPVLVEAAGTGNAVARALAEFGDLAVPTILATWNERAKRGELSLRLLGLPFGLLRSLATMAEQGRLSDASRTLVLPVARAAIERPESETTLEGGIDLALALRDPQLVEQVEAIIQDVGEVYRRGVQDPEAAERVQRWAAEALEKLR